MIGWTLLSLPFRHCWADIWVYIAQLNWGPRNFHYSLTSFSLPLTGKRHDGLLRRQMYQTWVHKLKECMYEDNNDNKRRWPVISLSWIWCHLFCYCYCYHYYCFFVFFVIKGISRDFVATICGHLNRCVQKNVCPSLDTFRNSIQMLMANLNLPLSF